MGPLSGSTKKPDVGGASRNRAGEEPEDYKRTQHEMMRKLIMISGLFHEM